MEQEKTIQKIKRIEQEALNKAFRYYTILGAVNNIHLTEREIQLLAFTSIKGNISYSSNKEEFCKLYNSSSPTINNMISKLKKFNMLVKDGGKIKVNPQILLNFNTNIILQISLV